MILGAMVAFAAPIALYPALRWNRWPRLILWSGLMALLPFTRLMVTRAHPILRAYVTFFTVASLVKLYDIHNQPAIAAEMPLRSYVGYLANWLQAMKGDSSFIFTAAGQASKASDYILSFSRSPSETLVA